MLSTGAKTEGPTTVRCGLDLIGVCCAEILSSMGAPIGWSGEDCIGGLVGAIFERKRDEGRKGREGKGRSPKDQTAQADSGPLEIGKVLVQVERFATARLGMYGWWKSSMSISKQYETL